MDHGSSGHPSFASQAHPSNTVKSVDAAQSKQTMSVPEEIPGGTRRAKDAEQPEQTKSGCFPNGQDSAARSSLSERVVELNYANDHWEGTGAGPLRWERPLDGGAIDRTPVQRDIPVFACMLHSYSRQVLCLPVRPLLGSRKWLAGSYIRLRHPLGWCVTSVLQNLYRVTGSYVRGLCVSDG